jgi:hypothetical protein
MRGGCVQINEKFQLHRITKVGVPGVLMKAIKSCKFQLDRDAALGVQGVSKNPIVHFFHTDVFHKLKIYDT